MEIYFHLIKIILYLIKHIFIISPFSSWYQKIYFHSVKINLYAVRIFLSYIYIFFIQVKCFYYMNFSLNTFLVSTSGLPFVFTKVRILLSVCKLNNSTRMWILNKHIAFSSVMVIKNGKTMKCLSISGSSHRRCSVRKGVLKNSANFTEKHLCWSLF